MNNSAITAILQLAPILFGIVLGRQLRYLGEPPNLATVAAQVAGALMFVGYCEAKINPRLFANPRCSKVCGAALLYSLPIILSFWALSIRSMNDGGGALIIVLLIPLPPLFAIPMLVRLRALRSVAGIALFEFACYLKLPTF